MNILITGASGFAGLWITRELIRRGHHLTVAVRDVTYAQHLFPQAKIIPCDFVKDTAISDWSSRLEAIDVVINCVGIFYHPDNKIMWAIHYETPKALFAAAEEKKLHAIVHLSALSIEHYNSQYAKSKKAAEDFLLTLTTPTIILRPSFIYGPAAAGGMFLMRSLAAFPAIMPLPGDGQQLFQPIYVADLATAIGNLLAKPMQHSLFLAAVSRTPLPLKEILLNLRTWLHLPKAYCLPIPLSLIKLGAKIGNYLPFSTINTPAIAMLKQGNITTTAETEKFIKEIDFEPNSFAAGLYKNPSNKADKWYARLVFIKPLLRLSLAFMWLFSALVSAFLFPYKSSLALLSQVGISQFWQPFFLYLACILNAIIGVALLFNYKTKLNCLLQIAVMTAYTIIISIKIPYFWLEPFGSIAKNIPILMSIIMLYLMD